MDVVLKPLVHRHAHVIGMYFHYSNELNIAVRKLPGVKWSQGNKCWYLPMTNEAISQIKAGLEGIADIDARILKSYIEKSKVVAATLPVNKTQTSLPLPPSAAWTLCDANLRELKKFVEQLALKAYSPSTVRTYRNELMQLLQLLKTKPVTGLTPDDLRRYMVYVMKEGLSENGAHSRLNALKFYFEQVLGREKFFWEIPRPKKPITLPNVLGEKEITRLFNALSNLKHKAILFTAYSAGLRVSEVVGLRIKDIDSDRMQIKIESAKGKKDRYVGLSPVLLDMLRSYYKKTRPAPKTYLFEGEAGGEKYSSRSAQKVFQRAKEKAGIKKDVSFHSLRHSFATHLLEKGIDIRYIKDILGHFSILTTERYVHVSKKSLINIISPLDDLWQKGDIR